MFADLTGMKALVTGGSRGIGYAIAKELKAAGAEVVISGSNPETLKPVADELGATFVAANLAEEGAAAQLAAEIGAVDILVNNAGITKDGLFARQSDEAWDDVINVNLNAAVKLTKALLPAMSKARFGRVINISSVVAHKGNTGQTNYIASKAAITGFTKGLAAEMGRRNITVNCVAPGFISTAMTDELPEKTADAFKAQIPAGRFGEVEDVAKAVRFLASKDAAYINGTTLHVNGGLYM